MGIYRIFMNNPPGTLFKFFLKKVLLLNKSLNRYRALFEERPYWREGIIQYHGLF